MAHTYIYLNQKQISKYKHKYKYIDLHQPGAELEGTCSEQYAHLRRVGGVEKAEQ